MPTRTPELSPADHPSDATPLDLAPGDRVVYAKHGPGLVRGVTERTVSGRAMAYYDIELHTGNMQVLVPIERAAQLGLRRVTPEADVQHLLAELAGPDLDLPASFPQRSRQLQGVMELGDVLQVARLLGTLERRSVARGLSGTEQTVLVDARRAVRVEVAVALGIPEADADRLIRERLA